jgi:hypothetical protein
MQSFWLSEPSPSSNRKAKESNLIYGPIKNGQSQSMDIKSYCLVLQRIILLVANSPSQGVMLHLHIKSP